MNTYQYIQERQKHIDNTLEKFLPDLTVEPVQLHTAMRYAVLNGGKRLRPLLVYATGETLGLSLDKLDCAACAVELIHAYSLVHDDLPAMDNDDFRRGQPSCHKAFTEATAILTGDALQALAFEILAKESNQQGQSLQMIMLLAKACGAMVGGQALEFTTLQKAIGVTELETIHSLKTGALMRASVQLAALVAEADAMQIQQLDHYASCLGLAFQIQDDIQDDIQKDQAIQDNCQPSYPGCLGLEVAQSRLQELRQQALAAIAQFGQNAEPLRNLVDYMIR